MATNKKQDEILSQIQLQSYTPRTQAEREAYARALYQAQLTSDLSNADNTYNTEKTNIENERLNSNTQYDNQYAKQQATNAQNVAAQDRASMSRGMQRSSYNAASVANLRSSGEQLLNDIETNRANANTGFDNRLSTAATNRTNSINTANSNYESNVLAKVGELADTDYTRQADATDKNNSTLLSWAQLLKNSGSGGSTKTTGDTTVDLTGDATLTTGTTPPPAATDYSDPTGGKNTGLTIAGTIQPTGKKIIARRMSKN